MCKYTLEITDLPSGSKLLWPVNSVEEAIEINKDIADSHTASVLIRESDKTSIPLISEVLS